MRRLLALLLIPVFLLTACGDSDEGGDDAAASSAKDDSALLDSVTVSGDEEPKIEVDDGFTVKESKTAVVSEGDGAETTEGGTVLVDYVAVNAKNGEPFDSSYQSGQPQTFPLDEQQLSPDLVTTLTDRNVGDRVALAVPAESVLGPQGNQQMQIAPKDTLVFVFDIQKASDPEALDKVEGDAAELPAELPQLQVNDEGTPTGFTKTDQTGPAPKQVVTETLIEGDGEEVEEGDLLTVHYLGQVYPDGTVFDQSYERGEPTTFQIGVGALIKAWDSELVGLKKGSRVVLEVPPAQGYGDQGSSDGAIKGGDTIMFVIDILGVS